MGILYMDHMLGVDPGKVLDREFETIMFGTLPCYGTVDTGAHVWLLGQGHGLRQLPLGVTRHPTKLDAAYTEKRQGFWLAWYCVVTRQ